MIFALILIMNMMLLNLFATLLIGLHVSKLDFKQLYKFKNAKTFYKLLTQG
jgi:hypothetical protein